MGQPSAIPLRERIIFALDVASREEALQWVERLEPQIHFFKIGLELFVSCGRDLVETIAGRGHKVMLDLKLYDVPTTVRRSLEALNGCGAHFVTIHGDHSIVQAAASADSDARILAVTVLTSMTQENLSELGSDKTLEELVALKAQLAIEHGCAGIVASPVEAAALRSRLGSTATIVTPGIRAAGDAVSGDDQQRTASAAEAIRNGADYLVIGRPIKDSPAPESIVETLQQQIQSAL